MATNPEIGFIQKGVWRRAADVYCAERDAALAEVERIRAQLTNDANEHAFAFGECVRQREALRQAASNAAKDANRVAEQRDEALAELAWLRHAAKEVLRDASQNVAVVGHPGWCGVTNDSINALASLLSLGGDNGD